MQEGEGRLPAWADWSASLSSPHIPTVNVCGEQPPPPQASAMMFFSISGLKPGSPCSLKLFSQQSRHGVKSCLDMRVFR